MNHNAILAHAKVTRDTGYGGKNRAGYWPYFHRLISRFNRRGDGGLAGATIDCLS